MAQSPAQAPSAESVQQAWHGWSTFVRFSAIGVVASSITVAVVVALLVF